MKKVSFAVVILVFASTFCIAFTILPENVGAITLYVGGSGPSNFTRIQDAIIASNDGDTIFVFNGSYQENLLVNKRLSLRGEDKNITRIEGNRVTHVIRVTSNQVDIRGFTIANSSWSHNDPAVEIDGALGCEISDNIIVDSYTGIYLSNSDGSTIRNNNLSRNVNGVSIRDSNGNLVANNSLSGNSDLGIGISYSNAITVVGNTVSNSDYGLSLFESHGSSFIDNTIISEIHGIFFYYGTNNTLSGNQMVIRGIYVEGNTLEHWNTNYVDASNRVGGKPVYWWNNVTGGTIPFDAGQIILANSTNVLIENQSLNGGSMGIAVAYSSWATISNSSISSILGYGMFVQHSDNITISNTNSSNNRVGVWGFSCYNISIVEGVFSNNGHDGIHLWYSSGNFTNNTAFSNGGVGFYLGVSRSVVLNNTVTHNWGWHNLPYGLIIGGANNTVMNNNVSSNDGHGIGATGADNAFLHNVASFNQYNGFYLRYFDRNLIVNNTANYNWNGFDLYVGDQVFMANNTALWNSYIPTPGPSTGRMGIGFLAVSNATLTNNFMIGNGIFIAGSLEHWNTHVIDTSNSVNGKPVQYLKNATGAVAPSGAGQVIIANCTDSVVENQAVGNGTAGIEVGFSSNITVTNNTASDGLVGIYLYSSHGNVLSNNTALTTNTTSLKLYKSSGNLVKGNSVSSMYSEGIYSWHSTSNSIVGNYVTASQDGIHLYDTPGTDVIGNNLTGNRIGIRVRSHEVVIAENLVASNTDVGFSVMSDRSTIFNNTISQSAYGLTFFSSHLNTINSNTITDNVVGMSLDSSYDNRIFHNNFVANLQQVSIDLDHNTWDNGYPSGGNYWSDYVGFDNCSGPNQDLCPDPDGIGDTPYVLDQDDMDNYPLMKPTLAELFRPPTIVRAVLAGASLENVTVNWSLSPDDGAGFQSVVNYKVYRGAVHSPSMSNYQLIVTLPNGTSEFTDVLAGEGNPNDYFYVICATNRDNRNACASDQAGKFTRPMSEGPNLVSIPLIPLDSHIETVLQTLSFDNAWLFDSLTDAWVSYASSKPYSNGFENVNNTIGFWVNVTMPSNLTVAGIVPRSTDISIHTGWNMIPYPSFNSTFTVGDMMSQVSALRVEGFDGLSPPYYLKKMTVLETLVPGYGYWVLADTDTLWTITNH